MQFDGNGARGNFQRAILSGPHKLVVDIFKDEMFLELYDVERDAQETTNLAFAPEHRALVEDLLSSLRGHMRDTELLTLPGDLYEGFIRDYGRLRREPSRE